MNLALPKDEVHVWRAPLDQPVPLGFDRILSEAELKRARRFRFERDCSRFIVAHGLLRIILSRYVNVEPSQLCFCSNLYGKPALVASSGQAAVRFNLSHSDGLALYAIAMDREVGIDLERIQTDFAFEQIGEQFLSPREAAELDALPTCLRREALLTWWTRKEAFVKARGQGLSLPLDQFSVSLAPSQPARLYTYEPGKALHWSLQDIMPGFGYVATLAVEGRNWQLKCWDGPADG
jgi:4'-phosphopantetheinyl transferase